MHAELCNCLMFKEYLLNFIGDYSSFCCASDVENSQKITSPEMCSFCLKRDKRNVHIDTSDEKKIKDLQYEQILHNYQEKRNHLVKAKECAAKKNSMHYALDSSKHNYNLAQRQVSLLV